MIIFNPSQGHLRRDLATCTALAGLLLICCNTVVAQSVPELVRPTSPSASDAASALDVPRGGIPGLQPARPAAAMKLDDPRPGAATWRPTPADSQLPTVDALPYRPPEGATAARARADSAEADEEWRRENNDFDPLLLETFAGVSYLLMAFGRAELPRPDELEGLDRDAVRLIDSTSGGGSIVGAAASMRISMISFGMRMAYASFPEASLLTVFGEVALRLRSNWIELYLGFGLGSGFLQDMPGRRPSSTSGVAMRLGLGVNFLLHPNISLGLGADAVAMSLAGRGISPGQFGDLSSNGNHPVGIQFPITLNLSVRL